MLRKRSKTAESYARFVGSKISLLASSGVRYEGVLWSMDLKRSRIGVKSVRSYGTEDRNTERQVDPSNEIYDLIVFRGEELDDLHVIEETRPPSDSAAKMRRERDTSTWLSNNGRICQDFSNGHSYAMSYSTSAQGVNRDPIVGDHYTWRQQLPSTSAPSSASNHASGYSIDRLSIATSGVQTDLRRVPNGHDIPYSAMKSVNYGDMDVLISESDIPYSAMKRVNYGGMDIVISESDIPYSAMKSVNYGGADVAISESDIPYSAMKSVNYGGIDVAISESDISYSAMKSTNYGGTAVVTLDPDIPCSAMKSTNYGGTNVADSDLDIPYSAMKSINYCGTDVATSKPDIPYSTKKITNYSGKDVATLEPDIPYSAKKSTNCSGKDVATLQPDIPYSAKKSTNYSSKNVATLEPNIPYSAKKSENNSGTHAATTEPWAPSACYPQPYRPKYHVPPQPRPQQQTTAFHPPQNGHRYQCPQAATQPPTGPQMREQHSSALHTLRASSQAPRTPTHGTAPPGHAEITSVRAGGDGRERWECPEQQPRPPPLPSGQRDAVAFHPPHYNRRDITDAEAPTDMMHEHHNGSHWYGARRALEESAHEFHTEEHAAENGERTTRAPRAYLHQQDAEFRPRGGRRDVKGAEASAGGMRGQRDEGNQWYGVQNEAPMGKGKESANENSVVGGMRGQRDDSSQWYGVQNEAPMGKGKESANENSVVGSRRGRRDDSSQWYGARRAVDEATLGKGKEPANDNSVVGSAFELWAANGREQHHQPQLERQNDHLERQNDHRDEESRSPSRGVYPGWRRFAEPSTPPPALRCEETYAPRRSAPPPSTVRGDNGDDTNGLAMHEQGVTISHIQGSSAAQGGVPECAIGDVCGTWGQQQNGSAGDPTGAPWDVQEEWATQEPELDHYGHTEDPHEETRGEERWCGDKDQEWRPAAQKCHDVDEEDWSWGAGDDMGWLGQKTNGADDTYEWESWNKKETSAPTSRESPGKQVDGWDRWNVEDYGWGQLGEASTPEANTHTSTGTLASAHEIHATADTPHHGATESAECHWQSSNEFSAAEMSIQENQAATGLGNEVDDDGERRMNDAELTTASEDKNKPGEDGTAKSTRGPRFSSLNDVFNYHRGSEAVFLEHLCQYGHTALSASQLRALSERSSVVYHVYLDFVNFCCSFGSHMNDETLWEKFAAATRKTFAQQYELPSEPPAIGTSQDLPAVRKSVTAPAHAPPTVQHNTSANGGQAMPMQTWCRSMPLSPPSSIRNEPLGRGSRTVTLADFAPMKEAKRKPKAPAVSGKRVPPKAPAAPTSLPIRLQDGSWSCPRCTLQNDYFHLECAACACPLEHASVLTEFPPLRS